jgi:hypothetical protein
MNWPTCWKTTATMTRCTAMPDTTIRCIWCDGTGFLCTVCGYNLERCTGETEIQGKPAHEFDPILCSACDGLGEWPDPNA